MKPVTLYTDGACRGNPGPGGWGSILEFKPSPQNSQRTTPASTRKSSAEGQHTTPTKIKKEVSGYQKQTTNNRMELTAVIEGLKQLKERCLVTIVTDSQYVKNGMTEWVEGWMNKGWKTANKKPVKNVDLWKQLIILVAKHDVRWKWVRGHSGHPENERCDELANAAIGKYFA